MTRPPDVYITLDPRRGLVLVRGRAAQAVAFSVAAGWPPRISSSGRGLVVPLPAADDVAAWCQWRGLLRVVHERREVAA